MNHDGFSAEHKLKILKRCFEGTENIAMLQLMKWFHVL